MTGSLKNAVFMVLGTVFMITGVIGIFVPVMPTVPFLLVAAFFYVRSSKRAYDWMVNHRVLGVYIRDYLEHGGVTAKTKVVAMVALWTSVIFSSFIFLNSWIYRGVFALCALAATIIFLRLKTVKRPDDTRG